MTEIRESTHPRANYTWDKQTECHNNRTAKCHATHSTNTGEVGYGQTGVHQVFMTEQTDPSGSCQWLYTLSVLTCKRCELINCDGKQLGNSLWLHSHLGGWKGVLRQIKPKLYPFVLWCHCWALFAVKGQALVLKEMRSQQRTKLQGWDWYACGLCEGLLAEIS